MSLLLLLVIHASDAVLVLVIINTISAAESFLSDTIEDQILRVREFVTMPACFGLLDWRELEDLLTLFIDVRTMRRRWTFLFFLLSVG